MSQSDPPSFHLRLTPPLQKRIKLAAVENERSMNAEILARLERSFAENDVDRAKAVKLLADAISLLDKGSGN
jgi:hypothetical protein